MPATEVFATFRYLGQVHLEPLYCLAHWSAFAIKVKKVKLPLPSCSSSVVSSFLTGFFLFVPFFSFQFQLPLICPTIFLLFYYSNTCFYIPISILFLPHAISNLPSYKQMHLSKFKSEQFGSFKKNTFLFLGFLFFTGWNWLVQHKHIYHWISVCFSDAFQTNLTVHALLFYCRKTCASLNTLLVTLCLENTLILFLETSNPIFLSCEVLLHFLLSETWDVSLVSSRKLVFSSHRKIISPFFFFALK